MRLGKELSKVADSYLGDIRLIGEFISDTEGFLTNKQNKKPNTPFTADEAKELRQLGEAIEKAALNVFGSGAELGRSSRKKEETKIVIRTNLSDRVGDFVLQLYKPIKQRTFLAEMSLSYLISHQEAFIKDYLYQLLIHKHQLLISSSSISYEEVAGHRSMRTLWSALAQKEVEALGYGSIDDVATYFSKKLKITLSSYKGWDLLREHNYRRNLLIHNRGKINEIYRKKTGSKQKTGRLTTDITYVASAIDNVVNFIEFIHASILAKFELK